MLSRGGALGGLVGSSNAVCAVQRARRRMNEIMLDRRLPRNITVSGEFDPVFSGGMESGWNARIAMFEMPPLAIPGQTALGMVFWAGVLFLLISTTPVR